MTIMARSMTVGWMSYNAVSVILKDVRGSWNVTSVSLRNVRDSMNVRTRCIAGDGSVSAASVTSTKVPNRICAGDAGVVTTEEQTPMTRIISGI